MSMYALTSAKGGINRLRTKGGASPENLYDLLNGYVDSSGVIQSRPGLQQVVMLPPGTRGLCAYSGRLVVFSHQPVTIPASSPGVDVEILVNPNDSSQPLKEIHFAAPYMGFLYVAAEFANGDVFHYWLQRVSTWQAGATHTFNELVQPTVPTGYAYRANRIGAAYPVWKPGVARSIGDRIEPTVANSYYYEATNVIGASPRSGDTEPQWPQASGATIYEDTDGGVSTGDVAGGSGSTTTLPPDIEERYSNQAGSKASVANRIYVK